LRDCPVAARDAGAWEQVAGKQCYTKARRP
jgi:hypothetical protein